MLIYLIKQFINEIEKDEIQLYNEAGLQFELGYFLRQQALELYFEYNISQLKFPIKNALKKEMDLYIKKENQYCIEIKFLLWRKYAAKPFAA